MNSDPGIEADNVYRTDTQAVAQGREHRLQRMSSKLSNGFAVACSSEIRAQATVWDCFTPFVLRPMEAGVTAQADDVLGSNLFDLLLPNIRADPFEPCFRSALSACAHGSPSRHD